jgi:hypothetical protein
VGASADLQATLLIEFSGGTGGGFYIPRLGFAYGLADSATARFGPLSCVSGTPCNLGFGSPGASIPFEFGVPHTQFLELNAQAWSSGTRLPGGTASVGLDGFLLVDESGQPLSNVTWNVVDTTALPEPSAFVPVFAALCIGLRCWARTTRT